MDLRVGRCECRGELACGKYDQLFHARGPGDVGLLHGFDSGHYGKFYAHWPFVRDDN